MWIGQTTVNTASDNPQIMQDTYHSSISYTAYGQLTAFPYLPPAGPEHCTAGDNDVCACISSSVDCVLGETAVNLDVELRVALAEGFNLGHHLRHELLAAETGLDSHDKGHLESIVSPECRIRS
jgi:hypothetical protein